MVLTSFTVEASPVADGPGLAEVIGEVGVVAVPDALVLPQILVRDALAEADIAKLEGHLTCGKLHLAHT